MDLAGRARRLERKISKAVDAAVTEFVGKPDGLAPIEIVYSAIDAAEGAIQEIGRGPIARSKYRFTAGSCLRVARYALVGPASMSP